MIATVAFLMLVIVNLVSVVRGEMILIAVRVEIKQRALSITRENFELYLLGLQDR